MEPKSNKKVVITSGYFNPLHIGHVNLMKDAKKMGDFLVVIVNNDEQVKIKGSTPFMPEEERIAIVRAIKYIDDVFLSIDKDKTVSESLVVVAKKYPNADLFFAKGGDRNSGNIPENEIRACKDFNIKIINDVGGGKIQSSSWLLKNVIDSESKKNDN
jgi:cytidyltransferase-like protein